MSLIPTYIHTARGRRFDKYLAAAGSGGVQIVRFAHQTDTNANGTQTMVFEQDSINNIDLDGGAHAVDVDYVQLDPSQASH